MSLVRHWSVLCLAFTVNALLCRSAHAQTASDDIVLRTSTVSPIDIRGDWVRVADPTAAGGAALTNADNAGALISPALASPQNYFEMRFNAQSGTAYHVWFRMRSASNSRSNDSVHVQFSDSVDSLDQADLPHRHDIVG